MSIVISISNLIIVIFVSSSFVSYVCKYRNFVSFGMCAALKKTKKKQKKKQKQRNLAARAIKEFACLLVFDLGIATGPGVDRRL